MTHIEYFLVFESILYGLIIAQVLNGWNQMIKHWGEYTFSFVHLVLTLSVFITVIQNYFSGALRLEAPNNILEFLAFNALFPAALYITCHQLFPKKYEGTDMLKFLLANRWKIIVPNMLFMSLNVLDSFLMREIFEWYNWAPHFFTMGLAVTFGVTCKEWALYLVAYFALAFSTAFYAITFALS